MNSEQNNTNSILDIIHEKVCNVEQTSNAQSTTTAIEDILKEQAKKERALRKATLTLKTSDTIDHDKLIEILEEWWCEGQGESALTFWKDKEFSYCQFIDPESKAVFLDWMRGGDAKLNEINKLILKPNNEKLHFKRKPVRLEINNVRPNIKKDIIKDQLIKMLGDKELVIDFKEGNPNPNSNIKSRNIFFRTTADGFDTIFRKMEGCVPYTNKETKTRIKLYIKINVRPWQCRDCFEYAFGPHKCEGKLCGQCGTKGHTAGDCKNKTKFCPNCKRRGHKAKETHCPTFQKQVAREIRKIDIPMEFYEDEQLRFVLLKNIQLRG